LTGITVAVSPDDFMLRAPLRFARTSLDQMGMREEMVCDGGLLGICTVSGQFIGCARSLASGGSPVRSVGDEQPCRRRGQ